MQPGGLPRPTNLSLCTCLQLYEPFFADFGPLNLGKTYRFCMRTQALLAVRGSPSSRHVSQNITASGWIAMLGASQRCRARAAVICTCAVRALCVCVQEAQRTGKKLYFYSGPHAHFKANAAVLVGAWRSASCDQSCSVPEVLLKLLFNHLPHRGFSTSSPIGVRIGPVPWHSWLCCLLIAPRWASTKSSS